MFGHSNYVSTEKTRVLASQMTEIWSLTRLFITCDQVIGLRLDPPYGKRAESLITARCRNWVIIEYPINHANETN